MIVQALCVLASVALQVVAKSPAVCTWKSNTGANFDLRPMQLSEQSTPYQIVDGDIPCTPETEPSYGYSWDFCKNMPTSLLPGPCKQMGKNAVVLQYAQYSDKDYYCFILGHFDAAQHELKYDLLDVKDPSKGVSVTYPSGEKCSETDATVLRTATIEIQCANVDRKVVSAQEPTKCGYHLVMKSYHGCPTECPITSNGLCDSHGHCAFDPKSKKPHCFCNEGYYGSACNSGSEPASYDGYSVQIGLLVTLLLVALGLTGGVVYMAYEVQEFRKQQISNHYSSLSNGDREMVETVNFTIN